MAFCRERFLSPEALFAVLDGRAEIARILADVGFVSPSYAQRIARGISEDDPHFDAFAANSRFVRAALCAGFYPNLIRVKHPPKKCAAALAMSQETSVAVSDMWRRRVDPKRSMPIPSSSSSTKGRKDVSSSIQRLSISRCPTTRASGSSTPTS